MMNKLVLSLILMGICSFYSTHASAQDDDPDKEVNLWMLKPVTVDGNSSEWHEPLNNYNSLTQLDFAFANDQQNIYLIIESTDPATTGRLIRGGVTLTINVQGKKKDGIKINFPGMQHSGGQKPDQEDSSTPPLPQEINAAHEQGSGINAIQVSGFKQIPDGPVNMPNQNGIQVASGLSKERDYICEFAIPLALLDLKGDKVKAIAYNIKINTAGRPVEHHDGKRPPEGGMRGGGMHGVGMGGGGGKHGGGMRGAPVDQSSNKASDFWVKFELAKPDASFRANE